MSLINDMLKNLEKNAQPVAVPKHFIDLKPVISSEWRANKKYYTLIAVLLALFVVSAIGFMLSHLKHTPPLARNNPVALPSLPTETKAETPSAMTTLTGVALHIQDDMTNLRFLLNQNALYRVSSDANKNDLVIILERTHLLAELPAINYAGSAVKNIQAYHDENNNLKLVLQLNPGAEVRRLETNEHEKSPELQLDIFYRDDANGETHPSAVQTEVKPTASDKPILQSRSEQAYWHAQQLLTMGNTIEAIKVLRQVIFSSPEHTEARLLLAKLLMQENEIIAAGEVLDAGLQQQPDNLSFVELKARLLVKENRVLPAIQLLEQVAPPIEENPEYHAFIAALYQRQGNAGMAANLYKQLVRLQPSNAKWWLGLGVALESAGNHRQALEAYAKANQTGGLSPELKAYVDSQLSSQV